MPRRKQAWMGWGAPMTRVAGWDFDHRLNGYITTAADTFSCDCGEEFPTPSGYRKCGSCGRAWNSYVIGTDGHGKEASLEKVICREIPVRKDVIVASKRPRTAAAFEEWAKERGYPTDTPASHDVRMHWHYDTGTGDPEDWEGVPKEWGAHGNWNPKGKPKKAHRRQAKGDCTCWEGYERVPGTKPCASGSCRKKKAARRYVAWCRQVDRMPNTKGFRRFLTAERMVRTSQRRTAADEPFRDVEYSPGVWRGIHHHYLYPDRIPKIYDYDQFRKDNPDWFNPDGSPNPPPMQDSNPYSMSSRKIAPPMNMSPRSRYQAPNVHPEYGFINDVYRRLSEDEIKQHWPEVPRDQWTGYPGAVRFPGGQYHEPKYYSAGMAADPGLYKVYEPGWETGVAPQKPKPSAMPQKIKPRPGDPSSAESGLTVAKRRRADRHNLRRRDLKELEEQQPDEEDISIHHFSRRRRAELFDITEEGETRKGKGKTDTPKMRKNPKDWSDRRQNGQYTKRWN